MEQIKEKINESPDKQLYIMSKNGMHNIINNKVIDLDEVLGQGNSRGINTTTGVS